MQGTTWFLGFSSNNNNTKLEAGGSSAMFLGKAADRELKGYVGWGLVVLGTDFPWRVSCPVMGTAERVGKPSQLCGREAGSPPRWPWPPCRSVKGFCPLV